MKPTLLGGLIATALLATSTQAQNLIINGGFESPTVPANTFSQTVPDSWLGSGAGGGYIGTINGNYSPSYPLPHTGQQYAHLGYSSSISQAFLVTITGQYTLSWYDSTEFNGPDQTSPYTVTILDTSANTVVTKNFDANASALGLWTQHSIQLSLVPGAYMLQFSGHAGLFSEQSLLDDVSIQPVSVQQACPCAGPVSGGTWKNHGQYVSCVAKAADAAVQNGQITEDQKDATVEDAAQSSCGKK